MGVVLISLCAASGVWSATAAAKPVLEEFSTGRLITEGETLDVTSSNVTFTPTATGTSLCNGSGSASNFFLTSKHAVFDFRPQGGKWEHCYSEHEVPPCEHATAIVGGSGGVVKVKETSGTYTISGYSVVLEKTVWPDEPCPPGTAGSSTNSTCTYHLGKLQYSLNADGLPIILRTVDPKPLKLTKKLSDTSCPAAMTVGGDWSLTTTGGAPVAIGNPDF
jgi:hypothetical protein